MSETTIPEDPLSISRDRLGQGSSIAVDIVRNEDDVIARFAANLLSEYVTARRAGREKVVFIVPVGPVGQYDLLADMCNAQRISLKDLVLINMDEYLTPNGSDWIPDSDPLSFRGHMEKHFFRVLDPDLAPPVDQRLFPNPHDLGAVPRAIGRYGGVDVCFGGIGITGHVAFNDPPEPGESVSLAEFREVPTRIVRLSRETLVINAATSARGNLDRMPRLAVTVGMKEILGSRKIRIYMSRPWHCAIVRKVLHGPITPAVPGSLLREHPNVRFTISEYVSELPEVVLS